MSPSIFQVIHYEVQMNNCVFLFCSISLFLLNTFVCSVCLLLPTNNRLWVVWTVFCLMNCFVFAFQSIVRRTLLSETLVVFLYCNHYRHLNPRRSLFIYLLAKSWTLGHILRITTVKITFTGSYFPGCLKCVTVLGTLRLWSAYACLFF